MSGEDDLRTAVAGALRQHMDRGSSGRLIADYGIDATDLATAALDAIRLATPAEPARESDGAGLRLTEDEREALRCHCGTHEPMSGKLRSVPLDAVIHHQGFCPVPAVERIIAARVAEAGARALEEYAAELDWVRPEVSPCAPTFACCESEGACDAMQRVVRVVGAEDLRDRARGLGGAS